MSQFVVVKISMAGDAAIYEDSAHGIIHEAKTFEEFQSRAGRIPENRLLPEAVAFLSGIFQRFYIVDKTRNDLLPLLLRGYTGPGSSSLRDAAKRFFASI